MHKIQRILHSEPGKVLISIILGLGLASLFKKVCNNRNCMVFYAPPSNKIEGKTFEFDNKCYEFKSRATECNDKLQSVEVPVIKPSNED
jgi:hypothetical protein